MAKVYLLKSNASVIGVFTNKEAFNKVWKRIQEKEDKFFEFFSSSEGLKVLKEQFFKSREAKKIFYVSISEDKYVPEEEREYNAQTSKIWEKIKSDIFCPDVCFEYVWETNFRGDYLELKALKEYNDFYEAGFSYEVCEENKVEEIYEI